MLNKLILIFAVTLFTNSHSFSQNEFGRTNVGLGIIYIKYDGYRLEKEKSTIDSNDVNDFIAPLTAYFDFNFPIKKIKEFSSIGLQPGITFSANGRSLGFSSPVFINFKHGADAQLQNYGTHFGFTVGLGGQLSGYATDDFEYLAVQPVGMAELCIRTRSASVHKIRLLSTPGFKAYNPPKSDLQGCDVKIRNYIGLFYLCNI